MLNIKITFTDDNPEHYEVMEAKNVLDAEGKLAIMARHWQKAIADHDMMLEDDHDCHLDANGEGHCDHPSHPRPLDEIDIPEGFANSADVHEYADNR